MAIRNRPSASRFTRAVCTFTAAAPKQIIARINKTNLSDIAITHLPAAAVVVVEQPPGSPRFAGSAHRRQLYRSRAGGLPRPYAVHDGVVRPPSLARVLSGAGPSSARGWRRFAAP